VSGFPGGRGEELGLKPPTVFLTPNTLPNHVLGDPLYAVSSSSTTVGSMPVGV